MTAATPTNREDRTIPLPLDGGGGSNRITPHLNPPPQGGRGYFIFSAKR